MHMNRQFNFLSMVPIDRVDCQDQCILKILLISREVFPLLIDEGLFLPDQFLHLRYFNLECFDSLIDTALLIEPAQVQSRQLRR